MAGGRGGLEIRPSPNRAGPWQRPRSGRELGPSHPMRKRRLAPTPCRPARPGYAPDARAEGRPFSDSRPRAFGSLPRVERKMPTPSTHHTSPRSSADPGRRRGPARAAPAARAARSRASRKACQQVVRGRSGATPGTSGGPRRRPARARCAAAARPPPPRTGTPEPTAHRLGRVYSVGARAGRGTISAAGERGTHRRDAGRRRAVRRRRRGEGATRAHAPARTRRSAARIRDAKGRVSVTASRDRAAAGAGEPAELIDRLLRRLDESYVFPEVAARVGEHVRAPGAGGVRRPRDGRGVARRPDPGPAGGEPRPAPVGALLPRAAAAGGRRVGGPRVSSRRGRSRRR
jgi:hypothetical protein